MIKNPGADSHTFSLSTSTGVEAETFTGAELMAVASFVTKAGWAEFSAMAADEDEAFLMKQGFDKLQDILARSSCAPR